MKKKVGKTEKITEVAKQPAYVTIKKVIEVEESYKVLSLTGAYVTTKGLEEALASGQLNLIQSATVESYVFVVDENGRRIATLEKDGGCGPDEKVTIEVL